MAREVAVIIIGSGTAAFSAAAEVKRATDDFIIISNGVYGTTCVLNGCMPSKVLIHAAELFDQRKIMAATGISGAENLKIDIGKVLHRVRELREHFLEHTLKAKEIYKDHIIEGEAYFLAANEIRVGKEVFKAKSVILATGSRPALPAEYNEFSDFILTSNDIFEQETLPDNIAVVGLSILGLEMAHTLARLGINVTAYHDHDLLGCLTDPEISAYALKVLSRDMEIHRGHPQIIKKGNGLEIKGVDKPIDKLFIAKSRIANIENMGLEELGVIKLGEPITNFDRETMQVGDLPIFVAGDVKEGRSILNEACEEARIAAHNATANKIKRFTRRTNLQICYTGPAIAIVGEPLAEIKGETAIGQFCFEDQGRAKVNGATDGLLKIYGDKKTGEILGGEMFAPEAEHLGHLLAWVVARKLTAAEVLELPFYHPTIEEGLLHSFRDLAKNLQN